MATLPGLPKLVQDNIERFTGRDWLLAPILEWLKTTDQRLLLLAGKPGSGKSMVAAWLAGAGPEPDGVESQEMLREVRGWVKGAHFCQAASGTTAPKAMAQNLAEQLAQNVAEFADAAVAALGERAKIIINQSATTVTGQQIGIQTGSLKLDLGELGDELSFDRVLRDPLKELYQRGYKQTILLLIDALDEAVTYTGSISIPQLLAKLEDLPPQVRILATTRPDPPVLYLFPGIKPLDLIAAAPPNIDDVQNYIRRRLEVSRAGAPQAGARADLAERLTQTARGNFLYAHLVLEDLLPRLDEVDDLAGLLLPASLADLYQKFVSRRIGTDRKLWIETVRPVLGLVAVGQGAGLTLRQIDRITRRDNELTVEDWSQYLDRAAPQGPFRLFHKSFADFLLDDDENEAFRVDAARTHEMVAAFYWPAANGAKPWTGWDDYACRYTATHLARASYGRPADEGHPLAARLVRLVTDPEFQAEHRSKVNDLAALQADLEQTLQAAAADSDPAAPRLLAEAAVALVAFRKRELRPESLFELARQGELESALNRLDLFEADATWRQLAMLALVWVSAAANPVKARQVLNRLAMPVGEPAARLAHYADAALGGPPVPAPPPEAAPEAQLAEALVQRVEGQGVNVELLQHYGHTAAMQDREGLTKTGYLSEEDGPVLVRFAAYNPGPGDELWQRYLATLTGYSYVEYRNQSLWYLLAEAVKHPRPEWVRESVAQIAAIALAPGGTDFQGSLWVTVLALQAAAGEAAAQQALEQYIAELYDTAYNLRPPSDAAGGMPMGGTGSQPGRYSDTWGSVKRRLGASAQCFALVLNRPADVGDCLRQALNMSQDGFAGFQMPACLTLAESILICWPATSPQGALGATWAEQALGFAQSAAHNVQDATFCARTTARCNAVRRLWPAPADWVLAAQRLASDASQPEFAALHVVGAGYPGRKHGGLPPPEAAGWADTLLKLADLYHRPLADFARLNQAEGWQADTRLPVGTEVRVPDRGLATLIAARFAAEALIDPALSQEERVALLQSLASVAAPNATALNTVLARLLLAARPSDPKLLEDLLALADKARHLGIDFTAAASNPALPS